MDSKRQILSRVMSVKHISQAQKNIPNLGHNPILVNDLYARLLQCCRKHGQIWCPIELGPECQTSRPGINGGYRVRARFFALLMLTVVPCYSAYEVGIQEQLVEVRMKVKTCTARINDERKTYRVQLPTR